MPRKWLTSKRRGKTDEKIVVDAVELKTIEVRLNSVKDATHRSRFIFLMMTVVSSSILLALWNITFSWAKDRAFSPRVLESNVNINLNEEDNEFKRIFTILKDNLRTNNLVSEEELNKLAEKEITKEKVNEYLKNEKIRVISNQEQAISEWIKNRTVSIGLLGIRIDATDFGVVGSFSLTIITVWFFFSIRRENRAIVTLLRDVHEDWKKDELNLGVCKMVYYGIVNNLVFIDLRGGDSPIGGLQKPETLLDSDNNQITSSTQLVDTEEKEKAPPASFARRIIKIIVFLPPVTILLVIATDIASLFMVSPYRDLHLPLWKIVKGHEMWIWIIAKIIFFDGIAFLAFLYTRKLCIRCREFSAKTRETIIDFRKSTKVE
ncbi:MAG TPA: hypothetical protein VF721_05675 [Pyrinomonadaceae bacterium]|jgi:hypothetical protein